MKSAPIDKAIFWPALLVVLAAVTPIILYPETSSDVLDSMLGAVTNNLGSMFLWFTVACFSLLMWLAFGRYGTVRFGGADTKPEFRTMSWIAMLFCASIGTALLYWATIEWAYYYQAPPFGIEARTPEAAEWAAMYGMFHWGPMAWALYSVPALPIAYAFHNRKIPFLRISQACRGVIGKHADGPLGKLIDVLFIFGLIGGTGTSLGLGTPIISESISALFGFERSFRLDAFVIVIWTAIFATSVWLGLDRGIRRLSDVNIWLGIFLLAFVFLFGPTLFIIDSFTNSIGLLAANFLQMSFYSDPLRQSSFPQTWTVFYWAWWIAYAPFMGLFVARISRGRTIRGVIAANLVWGSLGCWLFFAAFGNTSLHYELSGVVPVIDIMNESSPQAAIVAVIEALPMGAFILTLFIAMCFIYSATTLDSSAYTISAVASKNLVAGEAEPRRWNRMFWALALGTVALALMYLGGLKPLQTAAVIVAVPLVFVIALSVWSLLRWLKEDASGEA
ncbi:MAG: BCCT family transporter [Xanthomonadales bacterium]|jgi:BCCT family betaine/carnitine transporter|nr:BCCT family transporter [Xanthomonadales bacterium]